MLDIKLIRENPQLVKEKSAQKNVDVDVDLILKLDAERHSLQMRIEALNQERTEAAKERRRIDDEFTALMLAVPNLPSDDTPVGAGEEQNVVLKIVGSPTHFDFAPKEHWELGAALGVIDNETAAKVSGARFTYLRGDLALLQFAIIQFVMQTLSDPQAVEKIAHAAGLKISTKPFTPVVPPVFIKPDVFQRMGRLEPRDERYYIPSDDAYLIGSAEHTLGPIHMDQTIPEAELPIRYIGYSTSFRREAGSYGKDTKGILRMHHFDKLEMETFCLPENSTEEQNLLVAIQEHIVASFGLPYRLVICSTGDMGDPDARHIDLETWMPGQGKYRETHSADLMTDYQARRLNIKVKRTTGPAAGKSELVHMNDATAVAIGRILIGIMENYQRADGSIGIPEILQPYMAGRTEIKEA
jgi:seryl-tRNA synthetase